MFSLNALASINLNVKLGQMIGDKVVEVNQVYKAEYGQEVVISSNGLKNKIILNLKKFSKILVNGNKISPVQIDMRLVNEMKKLVGRPQTVTSFYNHTAQFAVPTSGIPTDKADLNVSLSFEELN
jgi:hypothetical protein